MINHLPSRAWLLHYAQMTALMLVPALLLLALIFSLLEPKPAGPAADDAARTYRFADGTRQAFPGNRFVALYGAPDTPVLGALGAQDITATIDRVKQLAASYAPLAPQKVMPTLEIITTIAAEEATANGDYSRETPVDQLKPWVDAARAAGVYVVLDLQPGLTDFEQQARSYQELLAEPHVGLAFDPEWRLQPGEQHLKDIGSVDSAEINRTADYLAAFTRSRGLPQKLFLIHQFRLDMITNRPGLNTGHPELATVIQMDGQGATTVKQQTYAAVTAVPPANVRFGWKNFYAKDPTPLTPAETMAQQPQPWYVSYQ